MQRVAGVFGDTKESQNRSLPALAASRLSKTAKGGASSVRMVPAAKMGQPPTRPIRQ